jgi:RNase P subunit RPR2
MHMNARRDADIELHSMYERLMCKTCAAVLSAAGRIQVPHSRIQIPHNDRALHMENCIFAAATLCLVGPAQRR